MNYVSIDIEGRTIERWQDYRLDSSMLVPSDSFNLSMFTDHTDPADLDELRFLLTPGAQVKAFVTTNNGKRFQQHTGILETRKIDGQRSGGMSIAISCLDHASHLTCSSVDLSESREAGTNFVDLVRELVSPWELEVSLDASASRHIASGARALTSNSRQLRQRARRMGIPAGDLTDALVNRATRRRQPIDSIVGLDARATRIAARRAARGASNGLTPSDIERVRLSAARAQAGETRWAFIARHAARFGLMIWFDPLGRLVVSSPDYGAVPSHRLVRRLVNDPSDPNNIETGGSMVNVGDRYSECKAYGRSHGRDVTRTRFQATATSSTMPFYRPLTVHDNSARSDEECLAVAKRELSKHEANAETYSYTIPFHGGDTLFAIDSIVEVYDELTGFDGTLYCAARTFTGDRGNGPKTDLDLRPIGSISL